MLTHDRCVNLPWRKAGKWIRVKVKFVLRQAERWNQSAALTWLGDSECCQSVRISLGKIIPAVIFRLWHLISYYFEHRMTQCRLNRRQSVERRIARKTVCIRETCCIVQSTYSSADCVERRVRVGAALLGEGGGDLFNDAVNISV
jgi:hypothetical protein